MACGLCWIGRPEVFGRRPAKEVMPATVLTAERQEPYRLVISGLSPKNSSWPIAFLTAASGRVRRMTRRTMETMVRMKRYRPPSKCT